MITISTDSYYVASILTGVLAIITDSDKEDLPGRDKMHAMTRLLGELAPGSWKIGVARKFDIQLGENLDGEMIDGLNLLRRQCRLFDKALEEILADRIP